MLGRLLQSAASTFGTHGAFRPPTPLESVAEESHTRNLLFPEPGTLPSQQLHGRPFPSTRQPATTSDGMHFDDRGGLDLSHSSDIRIIISQDANARYSQPQILFDSKPPKYGMSRATSPVQATNTPELQRSLSRTKSMTTPNMLPSQRQDAASSSNHRALQTSPTSPRSPESRFRSVFGDAGARRSHAGSLAREAETLQGRFYRESKEDTDALLGCMFGAPGFRLEPSMKLHVIPPNPFESLGQSPKNGLQARPVSSGGFARQRAQLTRSPSAVEMPGNVWGQGVFDARCGQKHTTSVMITRLFAINLMHDLAVDDSRSPTDVGQSATGSTDAASSDNPVLGQQSATKNVKQRKTPMFAIAIILDLPTQTRSRHARRRGSQQTLSTANSSFDEGKRTGPGTSGSGTLLDLIESLASHAPDVTVNSQVSYLLQHWGVLREALDHLESQARSQLTRILEQNAVLAIPILPLPADTARKKRTKQTSQQGVYATPECLQHDERTAEYTDIWARRLASTLRTRQVNTGQSRWGAWKEEARWIARLARAREQPSFLSCFLNAFLGTHLAWVESLSFPMNRPANQKWPGKSPGRHADLPAAVRQQRPRVRTVILARDKMTGRRLVFLASEFLSPSMSQRRALQYRIGEPQHRFVESPVSSSIGQMPRSVPASMASPFKGSAVKTAHGRGHHRAVSFSLLDPNAAAGIGSSAGVVESDRTQGSPTQPTKPLVPFSTRPQGSRKASLSAVTADPTIPVPHFTSPTPNLSQDQLAGSAETAHSLASIALSHNLKRSESGTASTRSSSGRWGRVVSGLWSAKSASSTDESDIVGLSPENFTRRYLESRGSSHGGRLARMAMEAAEIQGSPEQSHPHPRIARQPSKPSINQERQEDHNGSPERSSAHEVPRQRRHDGPPVKLSMNEDEGFIDVSLEPTQSLGSSFTSAKATAWPPHHPHVGSMEHSMPYLPSGPSTGQRSTGAEPCVAGWLKAFNPDFVLQSILPYEALVDNIKASMQADARLDLNKGDGAGDAPAAWSDVSVCLLVDTDRCTVKRLRLQRRLSRRSEDSHAQGGGAQSFEAERQSPEIEERFTSEAVTGLDSALNVALLSLLGQSGDSTATHSLSSSPSYSNRPGAGVAAAAAAERGASADRREAAMNLYFRNEAGLHHEECRRTMLGALEDVVTSVLDEQEPSEEKTSLLKDGVRKWLAIGG